MRTLVHESLTALAACVLTFVGCALLYPLTVWGLAWLCFPHQAEGSLVVKPNGMVVGSELIAQSFVKDEYFHPRPSAVDYNGAATGGSNLGTKNPDLKAKYAERAKAMKALPEAPAPLDLVTASGSGVDPEITLASAQYQAERVAAARKLPIEKVRALLERHADRSGAILGAAARVNVLLLNLELDQLEASD